MAKPEVLNILVDSEYENSSSTLSPTISWNYYDPDGDVQDTYRLKIGRSRGKGDILDTGNVVSEELHHTVTTLGYGSELKYGLKYYVTLSVSNLSGISEEAETYFFTSGSYWNSYVDNAIGWTIEFYYRMDATYSSISSFDEDSYPHHDLEIGDGTYLMSVEFFADRVLVKTSEISTYYVDSTKFHLYRITGEENDVKLYVDGVLALNIIGKNTVQAPTASLKISSAPNGLEIVSLWGSFFVDADGAFSPNAVFTSSEISSLFFDGEEVVDFLFDKDSRNKAYIATNPVDIDMSGKIYSVSKNAYRTKYDCRPLVALEANKMLIDGKSSKWISTEDEIFKISGDKIGSFTYSVELNSESNLVNFSKIENCSGIRGVFDEFLRVDTVSEGSGKVWYYQTIKTFGNSWFANAENSIGWTVDFKIRIADDQQAISETSGIVINDGTHEETIYFFEDRVSLSNANITSFYDFSSDFVDVRIIGKGNDIFVFAKDEDSWEKLIDGTGSFVGKAQTYADCSSHSAVALTSQRAYSVWSSNKSGSWQIYLGEYNGTTWEQEKQLTYDGGNRTNPSIAVDSNNIAHIVYQDDQFGNSEIVYVKYNGYGVFEKVQITDSVGDSIKPKIVIDSSDNIYVAWLDNRLGNYHVYSARYSASEKMWYSSNNDEEDVRLSGFGSAYDASMLSMSSNGGRVAIAWADNRNIFGNVYFSYWSNRGWIKEKLVSNILYGASNPDVTINTSGEYNFVWQDTRFGNSQIYYRRYSGSFLSEVRISNSVNSSKYPSISTFSDSDIQILWLEGISGTNSIEMRRTVDGVFRSSIETFETSLYGNVLSLDVISFPSKREILSMFTSGYENFTTVYSFEMFLPKTDDDQSDDVSSLVVRASNSSNTKSIAFGNISQLNAGISEWADIKYYTGASVAPIQIISWLFDGLRDFDVDNEGNLYAIDKNGLKIYSSILSSSSLVQNEYMVDASLQSPADSDKVFVDSFGNIYVSSGQRLYFHYKLDSQAVDTDHQWMEIDIAYSLGSIECMDEDSETGNIWIGFENGAISFSTPLMVASNSLNSQNSNLYISGNKVNGFCFSSFYIYAATNYGIAKINRENESETFVTIEDGLMDQNIISVGMESDEIVWAIGNRGLIQLYGETISIYRRKLSSDYINDFSIDTNGNIWLANNLGIEYFNPAENYHSLISSSEGLVSSSALTNYKSYKVMTDEELDRYYYHIVQVNGVYRDSSFFYLDSNNGLLIFNSPLTSSDVVKLVYFKYVVPIYDFSDPKLFLEIASSGAKRITGLAYGSSNDQIAVSFILDGDSYVYKFSDSSAHEVYPFGTIIYDKTPPVGTMDITDQLSATQVVLSLSASDNVSGVENMVISKYPNFTLDGSTPIIPIPFAESVNYDLGSAVGVGVSNHTFSGTYGSVFCVFERSVDNELQSDLFAGASSDAQVYKFDKTSRVWGNVENLDAEQILCMVQYLGKIYVGTGDTGKIFVSTNGEDYSVLTQLSDSYIYSMLSGSDDRLYIGTGISGKLYVYDGSSTTLLFDFDEDGIYSLVEFSGFIYMGTGDKGRIYRYNMANGSVEIVFDDSDTKIISIGVGKDYNSDSETIYVGTSPNGKILRLVPSRDIFVKSFESVFSNCYSIRQFSNSTDGSTSDLYACVDSRLLKLGTNSWSVAYIDADLEDIKDMAIFNGELFALTESGIKTLSLNVDKYVYVKFIDYAGNETVLYDSSGVLKPRGDSERLYDVLTAEDLAGFSLKNRILVVDASAVVTKTIAGNRPFLSAGYIDRETAIYDSEIFNGTNSLVAWDTISYTGTVPTGTEISIQIRSSQVESQIEDEEWSDAISSGQSINGMVGQYMQFRATLSSTVRGITPVLHNVTISSKSTFAVHYFTTNFTLSSNLKSGIITANTITPTGTELIFGVTSGTSTDWSDYQIVELNKVFYMENENSDSNIKVGVKFLSTTETVPELHEFGVMFTTENGELIKLNLSQN